MEKKSIFTISVGTAALLGVVAAIVFKNKKKQQQLEVKETKTEEEKAWYVD